METPTVEATSELQATPAAESTIPPAAESTIPPAAESTTAKATRVTIAKDPKKVTAGLKGAAARKAKQERLLEQLRKAKDGLRADPQEHHAPAAAEATTPPANPTSSLWPYAVFAGAAALAFFAITQKNVPAVEKKTAVLDKQRGPFYMQ